MRNDVAEPDFTWAPKRQVRKFS